MTLPTTPKPEGIDLYVNANGSIIIRVPKGDGTTWNAHDLHTTNLENARKQLARYSSKNKLDLDIAKVPILSPYGPLEDNGIPVARQVREKREAQPGYKPRYSAPRGNGKALVPYSEENAAKARAALAKQRERAKRMEQAAPLVSALAAAMQVMAINLKQLQEIIEGDGE